jgi:hypothetical protein
MCKNMGPKDEVWACNICNLTGLVPAEVAEKCIHPGCDKPPLKRGPLCQEHGCFKCGEVILADTEDWDEPLCDECYESSRWN